MSDFKLINAGNSEPKPGKVHLSFSSSVPARFELMIDDNGSAHLFGYSGISEDSAQEPNLVFDTDGSFGTFPDAEPVAQAA